jgi:purine-binding chemotaxis protein CheW
MKKARSKYSNPDFQFVRFRLAGHEFGLDVSAVREIIKYKTPETGGHPPFAEGFVRIRSMLVPVIDLKKRFSLPPSTPESLMIIIASVDSIITGLIVDAISDITPGVRDFTLKPAGAGFPWDALVEAEVESEGAHVLVLNADSLLTKEEKAALSGPLTPKEAEALKAEMSLKKSGFM